MKPFQSDREENPMKRTVTLVACFGLAVLVIGASIAGAQAWLMSSDGVESLTKELTEKRLGERVATFSGDGVLIRGKVIEERVVFVATLDDGSLCVNDSNITQTKWSGGCNDSSMPLGGKSFRVSFTAEGGPTVDTLTDARLSGLVDSSVHRLVVRMTDGSSREITLSNEVAGTAYRAFAYRVAKSDILAGATPRTVIAYDAEGKELDRQATGLS
jgi:hypothetical protein